MRPSLGGQNATPSQGSQAPVVITALPNIFTVAGAVLDSHQLPNSPPEGGTLRFLISRLLQLDSFRFATFNGKKQTLLCNPKIRLYINV